MEALDCVYGGYYSAGAPQFGQEKKAGCGDHFIVEDLLDFSNEEEADDNGADGALEAQTGNSTESPIVTAVDSCNFSFSGGDKHFPGVDDARLSGDLCEPHDDVAELEWLSNFVEDSFSSEELQKLQLISGVKSVTGSGLGSGSDSSSSDTRGSQITSSLGEVAAQPPVPFFLPDAAAVPGKARSKRSRAAPNNSWSTRLLVLSPTPATSSSDPDSILLGPIAAVKKGPKPVRKKELPPLVAASDGRKCLHCATDKTPQWRTGPMGPKTLCNACGVRYKSGRLVPEYRPAASPTFVRSKHSNSHRKVLELRRQKDDEEQQRQFLHPWAAAVNEGAAAGPAAAGGDDFLMHHGLGPDFRQLV